MDRDADDATPPTSIEERIEGWIRFFLRESMLGPLFVVILCHLIAFLVPAILLGVRDRNLAGLGALAILLVVSGSALQRDWQRYRRPGPIGGTLIAVWTGAIAASWVAARTGIF